MARLERIKKRLDNWALWAARQNDAGLGFHAKNILAVDVWGRGSYNGAVIPHFEQEAEETDQAVQALKPGKHHLHLTLDWIYLRDLGVNETARRIGKSVATVHSHLDQADQAIAAWLEEKAVERERQRVAREADNAKMSSTG